MVMGIENMGSDSFGSVSDLVDDIGGQSEIVVGPPVSFLERAEMTLRAEALESSGQYGRSERVINVNGVDDSTRTLVHSNTRHGTAAEAERLLESTSQNIAGSNESIVVSSHSGHSRDNSSSHSVESFMLDVSIMTLSSICYWIPYPS